MAVTGGLQSIPLSGGGNALVVLAPDALSVGNVQQMLPLCQFANDLASWSYVCTAYQADLDLQRAKEDLGKQVDNADYNRLSLAIKYLAPGICDWQGLALCVWQELTFECRFLAVLLRGQSGAWHVGRLLQPVRLRGKRRGNQDSDLRGRRRLRRERGRRERLRPVRRQNGGQRPSLQGLHRRHDQELHQVRDGDRRHGAERVSGNPQLACSQAIACPNT